MMGTHGILIYNIYIYIYYMVNICLIIFKLSLEFAIANFQARDVASLKDQIALVHQGHFRTVLAVQHKLGSRLSR